MTELILGLLGVVVFVCLILAVPILLCLAIKDIKSHTTKNK